MVSGVKACDCNYDCYNVVWAPLLVTKNVALVLLMHCICNYDCYGFWRKSLLLKLRFLRCGAVITLQRIMSDGAVVYNLDGYGLRVVT
jgi:hypothetical protein